MPKVTLKKTAPADTYGAKYMPASYDVMVDGRKVGELVGRSQGRNGNDYWHDLRDLRGEDLAGAFEVRGSRREALDAAALEMAARCHSEHRGKSR